MKRKIIEELNAWKESKRRKPLILRGARQVGKTWILEEFGRSFPDGFVRINFDREPEIAQFFRSTKDVRRIVTNLSMATGRTITANTLIIFDEIQSCEEALNSLKYFCEDAPEYYIAAAGSLLGLKLSSGFPVGKVDFLNMGPMTLEEFLLASDDAGLVDYINSINDISAVPDYFASRLTEKLKMYFLTGGMPEAVRAWTEDGDVNEVNRILFAINEAYESDFGKHAPNSDVPKISYIWRSLPSQLARENKKFLYSAVRPGARAREYENALNWLINADLAYKTPRITKPGLPVSAYEDLSAFKIYMLDVGLLRRLAGLSHTAFTEGSRLFTEFKGALTENYILQTLTRIYETAPRYWSETAHEVDFIIQKDNLIVPVEVKSGESVGAASLKRYMRDYEAETPLAVRFSMKNLSLDGKVLNVPLYLADITDRLLTIALDR